MIVGPLPEADQVAGQKDVQSNKQMRASHHILHMLVAQKSITRERHKLELLAASIMMPEKEDGH